MLLSRPLIVILNSPRLNFTGEPTLSFLIHRSVDCLGIKRQAAVRGKKKMKVVEITIRYFQIPLLFFFFFFFCTCRLVCFGDRCALCSLKRVSPLGHSGARENWLAEAGLPSAFVFFEESEDGRKKRGN